MTELNKVLKYLESKPAVLQVGQLPRRIKTTCFIMQNRLITAIDIDNPSYKTMSDLMKDTIISIGEMRGDVERVIRQNYNDLYVLDGVLFIDAIEMLAATSLDSHQNCVTYLADLAVISLTAIEFNRSKDSEFVLVFDTFIYICIIALNLLNTVMKLPLEKEGVGLAFGGRRKQAAG